jgi:hypothetical protein
MDKQTTRELDRITHGVPRKLQTVTHELVDTTEEDMMKELVRSGRLNSRSQRRVEEMIDRGAFRRSETIVDEDIVKELDRYHSMMIRRANGKGLLGDPNTDKFLQSRAKRIKDMKQRG